MNTRLKFRVIGGSIAGVAIIMVVSVASRAEVSTTARLVVLNIGPQILAALLSDRVRSAPVAEIVNSVLTKDGRS